ncbi:MAG TPA: tetratricopeptide repeat protein [Candidatus Sulfotelmatobacter sp.]|jgi:tetratricopeptide (TPR) repeat protein|nr:tetratricopeptide repeat protein [Candidatus Sulfotelmatobacter sp.]
MNRSVVVRLLVVGFLITALFTGCSRDPNVRKQKYLESGDRYFGKGKYREAAIQYSNAVQVDSRFAQAHYQLGQTYLKLGDSSRAFQELSRTVELAPDNYHAHIDLANLLVAARNSDGSPNSDYMKQARVHLDLLHEKQPQNPEVFEAWADYYAAQGNLGAALQEIQKAIAADPKRSESYLNLALLQLRSNLIDQAEPNFKKAAELDPKAMNAQLALGGFYQSRNRLPEAEKQFKHAIELAPKDPTPREALVRLYMAEGRKPDAEALLRQAKADLSDVPEGYRMLGDFYFASGDLDKATAEYSSLYSDHPRDPQVKKNYIQLLILKSRLDEAAKLNDEVLKTNPHDVDALVYRGQIQLRRNDAIGAVDSLQEALKNDSGNAVAHYHLGAAFDMQHNDTRAESEWREAVRLRPDLTDAQRALAALEMRRGDLEGLTQTAQLIIAAAPQAPDGYLLRAMAEMNRQKYSDAQQDLTKAMGLAPGSPAPYVQMGTLYQLQKQYLEAIKFYQQALDKDAASTDALQGIMNVYLLQKQPDQAVAAARAQIAKSPDTGGFYDLLGTALFQNKKDLSGADAAFHKAIELDKNNSDALLKLGQVQAAQGSVGQALALYQQSIKDHPREIAFYILAGEMYESQNDWSNAKTMYQKALEIQPDNPLASNNLAYVMLQQGGNVDVALAMAQTAHRGMPDSSNAADTLGWAYYQKGVYQSAIEMFQESLRINEKRGAADDPTIHYHLGLAYQKVNQPAQARQQLERALKINPNNNDAKKALSELRG